MTTPVTGAASGVAQPIRLERRGRALHIAIDRPEVRNAMDARAHHLLSEALDLFEADDDLWVAVLTGTGDKAFSAGRDLKEVARMAAAGEAERQDHAELWARTRRLTDRFALSKPIVARLNGLALGGGLELALACDIIVAADHAELGLPEPRRGLIATAGGVHRLPRQIPLKVAMGHLLTGRSMTAARAYQLGLVNEVVPFADLDRAVEAWVADILLCAPLSLRATKQSAMDGLGRPLPEAAAGVYAWEARRQASQDSIEGPLAFTQGRHPVWSGR